MDTQSPGTVTVYLRTYRGSEPAVLIVAEQHHLDVEWERVEDEATGNPEVRNVREFALPLSGYRWTATKVTTWLSDGSEHDMGLRGNLKGGACSGVAFTRHALRIPLSDWKLGFVPEADDEEDDCDCTNCLLATARDPITREMVEKHMADHQAAWEAMSGRQKSLIDAHNQAAWELAQGMMRERVKISEYMAEMPENTRKAVEHLLTTGEWNEEPEKTVTLPVKKNEPPKSDRGGFEFF